MKDANCDMQAVINSPTSIDSIWDTSAVSLYDIYSEGTKASFANAALFSSGVVTGGIDTGDA